MQNQNWQYLCERFAMKSEVRQGDGLLPKYNYFFFLEESLPKVRKQCNGGHMGNGKFNIHAYADDIVILGDTEEDTHQLFRVLIQDIEETGLKINIVKLNI